MATSSSADSVGVRSLAVKVARLSQLVDEAASGRDVVIARAGRPVARLTRLAKAGARRRLGVLDRRRLRIPDDFKRPLPPDLLRRLEDE